MCILLKARLESRTKLPNLVRSRFPLILNEITAHKVFCFLGLDDTAYHDYNYASTI